MVRQWVQRILTTSLTWATLAASVWAETRAEEVPEEKAYAPVYIIIIFAIGLGLIVICRSGKRTLEFRRD